MGQRNLQRRSKELLDVASYGANEARGAIGIPKMLESKKAVKKGKQTYVLVPVKR